MIVIGNDMTEYSGLAQHLWQSPVKRFDAAPAFLQKRCPPRQQIPPCRHARQRSRPMLSEYDGFLCGTVNIRRTRPTAIGWKAAPIQRIQQYQNGLHA